MSVAEATSTASDAALRIVQEWITGERSVTQRIFFAESTDVAVALAGQLGDHDALLAPSGHGLTVTRGTVVSYSGRLDAAGDELVVGEQTIELVEYVAAAFVDVVVPTAVRLGDIVGWRAFIDDADLARSTGVIPQALIHPGLVLAERAALEGATAAPTRLSTISVRADGRVTMGSQGIELGTVDELDVILASRPSRLLALAGGIPQDALFADVRQRPWIERYLRAADVARVLRLEPARDLIGGFGCTLVNDLRGDAEPIADDPFLIVSDDEIVLADVRSLRRHRLDTFTARVVEIVQTSTGLSLAASRVAADAGIPMTSAKGLCEEAVERLRVCFGRPADGLSITGVPA